MVLFFQGRRLLVGAGGSRGLILEENSRCGHPGRTGMEFLGRPGWVRGPACNHAVRSGFELSGTESYGFAAGR